KKSPTAFSSSPTDSRTPSRSMSGSKKPSANSTFPNANPAPNASKHSSKPTSASTPATPNNTSSTTCARKGFDTSPQIPTIAPMSDRTIEVLFSPAEYATLPQRDLSQTTCVVFDILRATTTMLTALSNGAAEII